MCPCAPFSQKSFYTDINVSLWYDIIKSNLKRPQIPRLLGPLPGEQTKKKAPCRRIATNYTAKLRISNGVKPFSGRSAHSCSIAHTLPPPVRPLPGPKIFSDTGTLFSASRKNFPLPHCRRIVIRAFGAGHRRLNVVFLI